MPRVPFYTAGKLASERTNVPSMDVGGVMFSQALAGVASTAVNMISASLEKQYRLLQQAEVSKQISAFDSEMAIASEQIKQEFISDPSAAIPALQEKRAELLDKYKSGISDKETKTIFDARGSGLVAQGTAKDQMWAFNQNNVLIQKTHMDRMTADAHFAYQSDNFDEVLQKAQLLEEDRDAFYGAWGVLKGSEAIDRGQEGIIKGYFYGQLDRGNAFKVLKEIENGEFGPTEGDETGLIHPSELKRMKNDALKMATSDMNDAAGVALMDAVNVGFDLDGLVNQPIGDTEEQINALSFKIGQTQEKVKAGQASQSEVDALKKEQTILQLARESQLIKSDMFVEGDPLVGAQMNEKMLNLFRNKDMKKGFDATLQEILDFQIELAENRENIDPKDFKAMTQLLEKSFQSEIVEMRKRGPFKTRESKMPFDESLVPEDKKRLSGSKKLRNVFSDIISQHDPEDGNVELFELMRVFYDDLTEAIDLEGEGLDVYSQENLNTLMYTAKKKMQLKKLGLPVLLGVKDMLNVGGQLYNIEGFDTDGMPMVGEVK